MSRYEENKKIVDDWLEAHKDDSMVAVEITKDIRYLMARQYLAGYNDGRFDVLQHINERSNA